MPQLPEVKVVQDFVQGDSFVTKVSHNPVIDITDAIFELTLSKIEGGDPILSVSHTVPAGADATGGIANIPILTADTSPVAPGEYFGSLKRTLLGGEVKTILRSGMKTGGGNLVRKIIVYKNLDISP